MKLDMRFGAFLLAVAAGFAVSALAADAPRPVSASEKISRPIRPDGFAPNMDVELQKAFRNALAKKTLKTLPVWTSTFSISGKSYSYTMIGSPPNGGATTNVPVVIVPVRLTVSDYLVGGSPLVLDANTITSHVLASPLFTALPANNNMQFGQAMLHAAFPTAPAAWGTVFTPTIGATLNLTSPAGAVKIKKVGAKYLATVKKASFLDNAISDATNAANAPGTIYIFVTYNTLEKSAFGYHSYNYGSGKTTALVYIYTSWLEGVDSAFSVPSPDSATLAHEMAETLYDPLITSKTLLWGDAFNGNKCFQSLIEVGDAVEDASAAQQLYTQAGTVDGQPFNFTVQVEANLAWFTRDHTAATYVYPANGALTSPAPLTCTP